MWSILLMGLVAQGLGTKVTYEAFGSETTTPLSADENKRQWSWQDSDTSANGQQDSYHPLSFTSNDAKLDQYNPNIQDSLGTAAEALTSSQSSVDSVIDTILRSNRQGRNLEGYDELYADPVVKNVLQGGNDTAARSFIRDKLCSLGLMNCGDTEERRPYFSPHRGDIRPQDVILAQPVTIKPVGRPLPAIPIKRPFGYGPPKPVHLGPGFDSDSIGGPVFSGPPIIHGGPYPGSPSFSKPPYSFGGPPFSGYRKPSSVLNTKPIYEDSNIDDGEYDFISQDKQEHLEKKQIILPSNSGVQQHVHHHYHHSQEQNKHPSVIVGTPGLAGPILSPSGINGNGLNGYGYGSSGTYGNSYGDFEEYKKTFKIKSPSVENSLDSNAGTSNSYANRFSSYEKFRPDLPFGGKQTGKVLNSGTGLNNFGSNNLGLGNFGTNNFGSNNFDNGLQSSSYEDCICVPYEQCTAINQAGRKDDLYLAIDPRNINKNIDAETDEVVITDANGTMSVIRVPKGVNITDQTELLKEKNITLNQTSENHINEKKSTETKRSKRAAKANAQAKEDTSEIQGRTVLDGIPSSKLNLKPTWGVSFGLPQSGASYPVNPYGPNPYPGYGSGANGIDLGLISVNPLVAVQVSKDEDGEKVVKPFVNLHVTPNKGLVHKLGHLLDYKKQTLLRPHDHSYYPEIPHAPHYYPTGPQHYQKPTFFEKPFHHQKYPSQHHQHHHQIPFSLVNNHQPNFDFSDDRYEGYPYHQNNDDYDYEDYNAYDNYSRNSKSNITATEDILHTNNQNQNKNQHTNTKSQVTFRDRKKRDLGPERQFGRPPVCGPRHVCCRRNQINGGLNRPRFGQCGVRNGQGVNGRIKTPSFVDGDSEFGEYPWQVAILKKDPAESVYACGGTLISSRHILTAAHCVKTHSTHELRARLGEWDVNHDVEFYPYIERDIISINVHPEFYAGTLYNDIAILKLDHDIDFEKNPHINPACLPNKHDDFTGARCWTTGWGKDAFGDFGKYQNILKEVDVPIVSNNVCQNQMRLTRLGQSFNLHPGFICAGGEEGKDACKGDGGGPMVCERNGVWNAIGVVSWGIGCGQPGIPGVYSRVSYYLDWIHQIISQY